MSAYLNTFDYIVWIIFVVLEIILYFKLTKTEHRPIKYFMGFAVFRDVVLTNLLAPSLLHQYFILYWSFQIIELIWFSYIASQIYRQLVGTQSNLLTKIVVGTTGILCLINLPLKYTLSLQTMQTHALLISTAVILSGLWFKNKKTNDYWMVLRLIGIGLITTLIWEYLGYQPLMWEVSWAAVLLGIFENSQEHRLPVSAKPLTEPV